MNEKERQTHFKAQYAKQDAYVERVYKTPLPCPVCHHLFSLWEVHGEEHIEYDNDTHYKADCPECGAKLNWQVALVGGRVYWERDPDDANAARKEKINGV